VALSWLHHIGIEWSDKLPPVKAYSNEELNILHQQIMANLNAPPTSSMGRLFDAVSALAGVRQKVNYEAQAAIEFEALADPKETGKYPFEIEAETINPGPMIGAVVNDYQQCIAASTISTKFHNTITP
jgi:hydrogenase maturation protein HypF